MKKTESKSRVVQSDISIKAWLAETPEADEVRPNQCPSCRAASRPVGGKRGLWGHGTRERQVRGPLSPDEEPTLITIRVRRYQCQQCETATTVVPRGVLTGRYYSGSAIGWANALYGIAKQALHEVRRRVCAWRSLIVTEHDGWPTLRRWIRDVRDDKLLEELVRPIPPEWTARRAAERIALTLANLGPPQRGRPVTERAFAGGAHAR